MCQAKLANSIIINTNIKNGNIEKEQFIGYMTNCMNADGVDFISISDCEKAEYKPSHFYTMYLEWLMAPSDKTYYIIYGDNKEDRSGVGELETKLPEELDKKFNWSFVNWNTENNGSGSSIVDTWEINPYENVLSLYDNWSIDLNIYRKLDEQGQYSREKLKVITVKYGAHPEIPTTLEAEGWTYEGCYKTLGHDDAKILTTTPYISRDGETDLFCQWSRKITLKITDVSTDENKNTTIKVIYDVIPTELAAVNPEYDKGGQLSGWYSLPYGNGEQVFTDSAFTLTKCDTLYNKIIFRISRGILLR